ncbi:MAG: dihydrolipoyllysine-residue acetyltransferase [Gammaproteobacteria bacterium]|nr:dihydrolipoyllysine-residue acetyltransferase [Gammaproteobacteria bacterium]
MTIKEIKVPNIGDVSDVEVIEISVSPGDRVKKEDSLVTLESEKASMEIPSSDEGTVEEVKVKLGDKVSEGSVIITLRTEEETSVSTEPSKTNEPIPPEKSEIKSPVASSTKQSKEVSVTIPDIGDAKDAEVIEILVEPGQHVNKEESLITLEGEKATMEIPSPFAGQIKTITLKMGDKVSKGDAILTLVISEEYPSTLSAELPSAPVREPSVPKVENASTKSSVTPVLATPSTSNESTHASPSVRRLAREFGIDLSRLKGTGPKQRIMKEDLQKYVKGVLSEGDSRGSGLQIPKMPEIDFSKYGETECIPLNKIKKLTGINVHRSWVTIPHVTQFGQADITDLEEFRKSQKEETEKQGVKLTPLVFIMKAVILSLKEFPHFNASLDSKGENLILKKYYNLGIAVDTPNGLVVPVVKDVDKKSTLELAQELAEISQKARSKGLSPAEMSGSCFTISSLGGIGGTGFTPIINAPDVAILGVSKASMTAIYQDEAFNPRLMLPLSLSYDHRVIDGADGARFIVYLAKYLSDIRTLLL